MKRTSPAAQQNGGVMLPLPPNYTINELVDQYQHFSLSISNDASQKPTSAAEKVPESIIPSISSPLTDSTSSPTLPTLRPLNYATPTLTNLPMPPLMTTTKPDLMRQPHDVEPLSRSSQTSWTQQEVLYIQQRQAMLTQDRGQQDVGFVWGSITNQPAILGPAAPPETVPQSSEVVTLQETTLPLTPPGRPLNTKEVEVQEDDVSNLMAMDDIDGYGGELSFLMNDMKMVDEGSYVHGHMPYCM